LFYTEQIALSSLGLAAFMLVILVLFNLGGVRAPAAYFLIGILLWFCMLQSGIHATLAGVLLAFTIPARPKYDPPRFTARMRGLLDRFETAHQRDTNILTNGDLLSLAQTLARDAHLVETPLQRMETSWHLPVALLVIPLFALANAGIPLHFESLGATLSHPVTLGAGAGLVLGKFIGITGASWLALRLGIGQLPSGTTLAQIAGVALLGGIGFTMSIFIAELAYIAHPDLLIMAKTGILAASLCSGALGYLWLLSVTRRPEN
jgi:Na+:H+ antiporter, NhaA family